MSAQPGHGVFKPKHEDFGKFIWNSETNELFGRTGTSWFKIGVFYMIYYSCLAAFFAAMMAIFLQTLDLHHKPKYTPREGSLLKHPALGFRPNPSLSHVDSTLIWVDLNKSENLNYWMNTLNEFMKDYNDTGRLEGKVRDCSFEEFKQEKLDEANGKPRDPTPCRFQDDMFSETCSPAEGWGYRTGTPCVLLKLNRMIDWEPDVYTSVDDLPEKMPDQLVQTIKERSEATGSVDPLVWVSCEGESPADNEYVQEISYSPYQGFPAFYFPYTKIESYRSPIVAVSFHNPRRNVLIAIECRVWAKNIKIEEGERLGIAHFEIMVD